MPVVTFTSSEREILGALMANEIDEISGTVNQSGRDINVIDKQLPIQIDFGTRVLEPALWLIGPVLGYGVAFLISNDLLISLVGLLVGLIPGMVFAVLRIRSLAYLRKLQQKIQADASQIDNFLEQRVIVLQNLAGILAKSIDVDKDVMKSIAAYRTGLSPNDDQGRNSNSSLLEAAISRINVTFEAYPNLQSQANISEAMRQNAYLQREITAARTLYNDTVTAWNQDIYSWPINQIVASRSGFTTRIPFVASEETKNLARGSFFS